MKGDRIDGTCSMHDRRNKYALYFSGKNWKLETTRKTQLKWERNVKMARKEIDCEGVNGLNWLRIASSGGLL